MSTAFGFSPRLLGQTEKALNAFLLRELDGTGLTEPQWVTLTLAATGGECDRGQFVDRVAGVLKVDRPRAGTLTAELVEAGLLAAAGAEGSGIEVTEAGERLHRRVRAATTAVTGRLWGDLPAEDLETAARVLGAVLERADAELAAA
jgi:DNA-binding MarR family transcriptional regulator